MLERDSRACSAARRGAGLLRGGLRAGGGRRRGRAAPAPASSTPTTSTRRSAGARWPPRARRARGSCCTCTTTGSCARSGRASPTARTARAATGATRCPGVRLNCRGGSRAEAAAYAAGLALWQQRLAAQADAFVVPSAFALARLRELGAPVGDRAQRARVGAARVRARLARGGRASYVLAAGRLTPEKGFADAVEACARAGLPLVVAGDGPQAAGAARAARTAPTCASPAASARRARRRCAARPPPPSCRRATPRSSRSPRWRRWRPGCRRRRRAGGLAEAVPEEGPIRPATSPRSPQRCARCGATRRRGSARSRGRGSAARPR